MSLEISDISHSSVSPSTKVRAEVLWRRLLCSPSFCPAASSSTLKKSVAYSCFFSFLFCYNCRRLISALCFYRLDFSIHTFKMSSADATEPKVEQTNTEVRLSMRFSICPSQVFDRSVSVSARHSPLSDDMSMLEGATPPRFIHVIYTDPPAFCLGPCCLRDRLLCVLHVRRW